MRELEVALDVQLAAAVPGRHDGDHVHPVEVVSEMPALADDRLFVVEVTRQHAGDEKPGRLLMRAGPTLALAEVAFGCCRAHEVGELERERSEPAEVVGVRDLEQALPEHAGADAIGVEDRLQRHALVKPSPPRIRQLRQLGFRRHPVLGQGMEVDLHVARDHGREVAVELGIRGVAVRLDVLAHRGADPLREAIDLLARQDQPGADLGWTHNGRPTSWDENRRVTSQEFIASQPKPR